MRELLTTLIDRVDGKNVQSVHHLQVGMGGGKSHTLLLLYYLSKAPDKALPIIKREKIASHIPDFRVVVLDGMRLNADYSTQYPDGSYVLTFWGHLFKQLGVYDKYKEVDDLTKCPSTPMLKEIFAEKPTLILFDEILNYVPNILNSPRQLDRMQAFLQNLTTAVKETTGCALVITTPIGVYEEAQKFVTAILNRYCSPTPVSGDREYKNIRRRALYKDNFQDHQSEIEAIAQHYEALVEKHQPDQAHNLAIQIQENYPFHPFVDRTLKNLKEKEEFQNVRDELRFLVGLIYSVQASKDPDTTLINIGHANLQDKYVRGGTVSKLQDPILLTRLDTDLETRIPLIPDQIQPTARKALTCIVLNSLHTASPLQQGITEEDAIFALLTPNTSPQLIKEALKQIRQNLWFVDTPNERYTFGRPNINHLVDSWIKRIEDSDQYKGRWWDRIQTELTRWHREATRYNFTTAREKGKSTLFSSGNVLTWVHRSEEIPDDMDLKLVLTDYTITPSGETRAVNTSEEAAQAVKDLYENYRTTSRNYKNTVYFLVANRTQLEKNGPITYAKQLMALEEMTKNRQQLHDMIGDSGLKTIDSMRMETERSLYPSTASVYQYLVYPSASGLSVIELGTDRIQTENIINLVEDKLRNQAKKIVEQISPRSIIDRYWPESGDRVDVKTIIEGFYRRPEKEVTTNQNNIYDAIREAIKEGYIAYTYGEETIFQQTLFDVRDDGILTRNPDISTVEFKAQDQLGQDISVSIIIDDMSQHNTPYSRTDLRNQRHKVRVQIPNGLTFEKWTDGITSEEREIEWTYNTTYICTFSLPPPPPVDEVDLSVYAVDRAKNESLQAHFAVNGVTYTTPQTIKVRKGRKQKIMIQPPQGYSFDSWNSGELSTNLDQLTEVDTNLTAYFNPIQPGAETITGTGSIQDMIKEIQEYLEKQVKETRLIFKIKINDLTKVYGAITMLHSPPYTLELTASADKNKPIQTLTLNAQANDKNQGDLKTIITQLRGFLEEAEVTIHNKEDDYKPLKTIMNETALTALGKTNGNLTYRLIAVADTDLPKPSRTLAGVLDKGNSKQATKQNPAVRPPTQVHLRVRHQRAGWRQR